LNHDFDSAALWNRIGHDRELLGELVSVFASEGPLMLAQIEMAVAHCEPELLQKASHKLKGSLLQFSASRAAQLAQQLEMMGKTGNIEGAPAVLTTLRGELQSVLISLRNMEAQPGRF
jgi:HPt (histidine-containing phosphotransfer) domain-containing protein